MPDLAKYKPTGYCYCRCGRPASPGRFFAQGHDRKAATTLDAIQNHRPIIDRLIDSGFHFGPGGRNLRDAALDSGAGFIACPVKGCEVYGRGAGMQRHIAEHS